MNAQIIALQCPQCGGTDTVDARVARFGYEFTCKHCKTTSVLVINSKLHIRTGGEHVCVDCGRVASSNARYCQCGASLVAQCRSCLKEFPVDHTLCDFCGWPSGLDPSSPEGHVVRSRRAIKELTNYDPNSVAAGFKELACIAPTQEAAEAVLAYYQRRPKAPFRGHALFVLGKMGPIGVAALVEISKTELCPELIESLSQSGEAGAKALLEVIPRAMRTKPSADFSPAPGLISKLGKCGPSAIPILMEYLLVQGFSAYAREALVQIGTPAIPELKRLTGFFADWDNKQLAKRVIQEIESGGRDANGN